MHDYCLLFKFSIKKLRNIFGLYKSLNKFKVLFNRNGHVFFVMQETRGTTESLLYGANDLHKRILPLIRATNYKQETTN